MANFQAQVGAWAKNSKAALEAIVHEAAQSVVDDMQTAVGNGGNMPVDTGFLRASLLASSSSMPQISEANVGAKDSSYSYSSGPVSLVINDTPIGGTLYCGYTAAYAAHVNYGSNGRAGRLFVELAAQKWPQFVKQAEERAAQAFGVK